MLSKGSRTQKDADCLLSIFKGQDGGHLWRRQRRDSMGFQGSGNTSVSPSRREHLLCIDQLHCILIICAVFCIYIKIQLVVVDLWDIDELKRNQ